MSSIRNGSAPMNRSRRAANAPSTASAQPSRLASPQPNAPSSVSTRTKSQRGGTKKVSILPILSAVTRPSLLPCLAHVVRCAIGEVALAGRLADLLDWNDQADARGRQNVAPVGDQLLVGLADVADLAVEVEEAERVHIAVLLAKRGVPVDLVGQRIPGEAYGRNAHVAQAKNVRPFFPQPLDRFVAVRAFPQV